MIFRPSEGPDRGCKNKWKIACVLFGFSLHYLYAWIRGEGASPLQVGKMDYSGNLAKKAAREGGFFTPKNTRGGKHDEMD